MEDFEIKTIISLNSPHLEFSSSGVSKTIRSLLRYSLLSQLHLRTLHEGKGQVPLTPSLYKPVLSLPKNPSCPAPNRPSPVIYCRSKQLLSQCLQVGGVSLSARGLLIRDELLPADITNRNLAVPSLHPAGISLLPINAT